MNHVDPTHHVFTEAEGARHLAAFEDLFPLMAVIAGALLLALAFGGLVRPETYPAPGDMGSASVSVPRALRT